MMNILIESKVRSAHGPLHDLLPKLSVNAVDVMDNASFHNRYGVLDVIHEYRFTLEFLPSYSPELSPIDKKMGTS